MSSPAALRNREPILEVLRELAPASGEVLEIASGDGTHCAHFAAALRELRWQPTEAEGELLPLIRESVGHLANVLPPRQLDVRKGPWPERVDLIVCINMIHISPWASCEALLQGAGRSLPPGGALYLYGPYRIEGEDFAPSNAAFDASLRSRDPEWGIRNLQDVQEVAGQHGLCLELRRPMPANNQSLIFRRSA